MLVFKIESCFCWNKWVKVKDQYMKIPLILFLKVIIVVKVIWMINTTLMTMQNDHNIHFKELHWFKTYVHLLSYTNNLIKSFSKARLWKRLWLILMTSFRYMWHILCLNYLLIFLLLINNKHINTKINGENINIYLFFQEYYYDKRKS